MRLFTYGSRFSKLRALIGFRSACVFSVQHLWNKMFPPRGGRLSCVRVGPYLFYFPSIDYFVGLFTEIFFNETYLLAPTQAPIRAIDCGANIGMSLLYIKVRAPNAQVMCFEPNPSARAVLEKNIEANGWQKTVTVFPCALGKAQGTADFFVSDTVPTSSGGGMVQGAVEKGRPVTSYPVTVEVLSSYLTQPVDLLKIDIEGGEFGVLEELVSSGTLKLVRSVQLEYHYAPTLLPKPLSALLSLLESNGFHTFAQPNTSPSKVVGRDREHTYMVFAWRPV